MRPPKQSIRQPSGRKDTCPGRVLHSDLGK
jgi:hypothetical protein